MHLPSRRSGFGPMLPVIALLAVIVLTSCSVVGPTGSSTASSSISASPSVTPSSTAPTLAAAVDIEEAGALRIEASEPDWVLLAGDSAWVAGVGAGVGRFDGKREYSRRR